MRLFDPVASERAGKAMKTFDNEWIVQLFQDHPTLFTKRMFGGLAIYLFARQMMVLVEPTRSGRWRWHGVLICTDHAHHASIVAEFPQLAPHEVLKKWLYLDSRHDDFESAIERVAHAIARNDQRFGIEPSPVSSAPRRGRAVSGRRPRAR